MRMYGAFLLALAAWYCWPDRNMFTTSFSELTLKLIITTAFAAWLAYLAFQFAVSSFESDRFWPWKWTRAVLILLAIRASFILAFFVGAWVLSSGWPKFNTLVTEYPIVSSIISFIWVSFCICAEDAEFLPDAQATTPTAGSGNE